MRIKQLANDWKLADRTQRSCSAMNLPQTQQPSSVDLGFNLVAGALVGSVIAVEVSLLDLLVWGIGSHGNIDLKELVGLSPQGTVLGGLCLLAAGLIGGLLSTILSRVAR